jgi:NAD(P)-dependent dehydrogenase (short-subunit alcohol dehydrogenase family)
MNKTLANRIAVVTGASRGLGRSIALALAREGAHVIAMARTVGGLEELDDAIRAEGGTATLVPADITDYPAIDRLGAAIFERWKKLDILVGNAGILGKLTPIPHVDQKLWDEVMAVNVTANYRLIRSLDPLLRASDAGRAVFVTSGLSRKCWPYWGPYAISKAALEAMVKTYAGETANTSALRVNCFSPGSTRTRMRAAAMPGEDPEKLPHPDVVAPQILPLCSPSLADNATVFKYDPEGLAKQYEI